MISHVVGGERIQTRAKYSEILELDSEQDRDKHNFLNPKTQIYINWYGGWVNWSELIES